MVSAPLTQGGYGLGRHRHRLFRGSLAAAQLGGNSKYFNIYEGIPEGLIKVDIQVGNLDAANANLDKLQSAELNAQVSAGSIQGIIVRSLQARLALAEGDYQRAAQLTAAALAAIGSSIDACQEEVRDLRVLQSQALHELRRSIIRDFVVCPAATAGSASR